METISKRFKTPKQAEKYQNSLYSKFPYVRLTCSPIWVTEGFYIWEVSM